MNGKSGGVNGAGGRRLLRWPGEGVLLDGFVVGVEGGFEEADGGDAAGHFLDVADFVFSERTAEKKLLTIGKPLLDDLVAADGVLPNAGWDVGPIGGVVEIDVAGFVAKMGEELFA